MEQSRQRPLLSMAGWCEARTSSHWTSGLRVLLEWGAGLVGAYAVLHKVREWKGTIRIWVDNDNVVRGLEKRLGVERADAVWAVADGWFGSALEERKVTTGGCNWERDQMVISGKQLTYYWRGCRAMWTGGGQLGQGAC